MDVVGVEVDSCGFEFGFFADFHGDDGGIPFFPPQVFAINIVIADIRGRLSFGAWVEESHHVVIGVHINELQLCDGDGAGIEESQCQEYLE